MQWLIHRKEQKSAAHWHLGDLMTGNNHLWCSSLVDINLRYIINLSDVCVYVFNSQCSLFVGRFMSAACWEWALQGLYAPMVLWCEEETLCVLCLRRLRWKRQQLHVTGVVRSAMHEAWWKRFITNYSVTVTKVQQEARLPQRNVSRPRGGG